MSKKICMFVWNHFTNDARVLRECTSLVEAGYTVKLIAIHDPKDKTMKKKENINGFEVIRVKRFPRYIELISYGIRKIKENVFFIIPTLMFLGIIFYFSKTVCLLLIFILMLLSINKIRTILIRLHIGLRMIYEGVKDNADLYHSNDLNTLPQGYICNKILGGKRKLVYDSHEVQSSRTGYGEFHRWMEKFFINKIDVMIMTTDTRADYVKELYNIEKPKVIHNYPFNTGDESINNKYDLHKKLDIPYDEPILLYQGGIQSGRGIEQIIDSVNSTYKGVFVLIGDGKLKPLIINKVKEMSLEDRVKFMDKVPVNELKYYTADAYLGFQVLNNVCFNHYSALSNKLFEYMMSGVPVIACDFPEIKRVVEGEQIGICVNSHDPQEIARGVNKLLEDKKLYELAKKNCLRAREIYNWDNEKKFFTKIYDELLY